MQNPIRYFLYICVKEWLNLLPPPSGRHGGHAARAHGSQADMVLRPLWRPSISGSPTYSNFVVILFARPPSAPFEEGLSSTVRSVRRPQWRPLESLTPAPAPAPGSEKNQPSAPFEEGLSSSVRSVRRPQWRPLKKPDAGPGPGPGLGKKSILHHQVRPIGFASPITKYGQSGFPRRVRPRHFRTRCDRFRTRLRSACIAWLDICGRGRLALTVRNHDGG